jgi:hypothetical protein
VLGRRKELRQEDTWSEEQDIRKQGRERKERKRDGTRHGKIVTDRRSKGVLRKAVVRATRLGEESA